MGYEEEWESFPILNKPEVSMEGSASRLEISFRSRVIERRLHKQKHRDVQIFSMEHDAVDAKNYI